MILKTCTMILKTWVGPDGMVRWSKDDPDDDWFLAQPETGVVDAGYGFYEAHMPATCPVGDFQTVKGLGLALRLVYDESMWEDT